jgi:outer membrane murein-binding lipoprotein Lpp
MVSRDLIKRFILPLIFLATSSALIWAGCISDCKDEYDSAVQSCKLLYDDSDDAEDFQMCIQAAKDEYQSCLEDCTS